MTCHKSELILKYLLFPHERSHTPLFLFTIQLFYSLSFIHTHTHTSTMKHISERTIILVHDLHCIALLHKELCLSSSIVLSNSDFCSVNQHVHMHRFNPVAHFGYTVYINPDSLEKCTCAIISAKLHIPEHAVLYQVSY